MSSRWTPALFLFSVTTWSLSCGVGATPLDGIDDSFIGNGKADEFGVAEGSAEARSLLAWVNGASVELLDGPVGLHELAARAIVDYRFGPDRQPGTADDETIDTLAELDAIEYIGSVAFEKLLAYWRKHVGVDNTKWLEIGMPLGQVDMTSYLRILAFNESVVETTDTLERLLCRLHGENPGLLRISCRRDDDFEATGELRTDGTFTVSERSLDAYKYMKVVGFLSAGMTLTITDYHYFAIDPCFWAQGSCNPDSHGAYIYNIKPAESETVGRLGEGCAVSSLDPRTMVIEFRRECLESTCQVCPACYSQVQACFCGEPGCAAQNICVHETVDFRRVDPYGLGCAEWDDAGAFRCWGGGEFRLCLKPENEGSTSEVSDVDAVVKGPECPAGYRQIEICRCNDTYCQPDLVCLHDSITTYYKTSIDHVCPPGTHFAERFYCAFDDFQICIPD